MHAIASRYAKALMEAALEAADDLDVLRSDFSDFIATLDQHPQLRRALESGALPAARRAALARAAAGRHTRNERLVRTLTLMAGRERAALYPETREALNRAVDRRRGVADVELVAAHEMGEQETERVRLRLREALGIEPRLRLRVDPSILGGFVARIGNRIYDASLERELARFEESGAP